MPSLRDPDPRSRPRRRFAFALPLVLICLACGDDDTRLDAGLDGGTDATVDASDAGPAVEQCDNGLDDDGDGEIDCDDLECAAAPLDPSDTQEAIPFAERVKFLWEGGACPPSQRDVLPSVFDETPIGVVYGRVLDEDGAPLPGVRVHALGRPDEGYTLTRGSGAYELAITAGTRTLVFALPGRYEAQRTLLVPFDTFTEAPDVALVELGPSTVVDTAAGAEVRVAASDADGDRTLSVLFPAGVTATVDGVPRSRLTFRARELTEGDLGPERMPGTLPPASAYTYAVELSVDEGEDVVFDRPVVLHLDNFLGFPVGEPVPVGSYDRAAGAWVPEVDGLVVEVLRVEDGLAVLDLDGDGVEEDAGTLTAYGVTEEERRSIAARGPGTYWRVGVTHFSSWDLNWPFGLPGDWIEPFLAFLGIEAFFEDTCHPGSQIRVERRVLGERFPVVGTPFGLHYTSDRQLGYLPSRTFRLQVTGDTLPASLIAVEVELHIAGQVYRQRLEPPEPNAVVELTWDGLDRYGRRFRGPAPYIARVGYVYPAVYRSAPAGTARALLTGLEPRSFGIDGEYDLEVDRRRRQHTVWRSRRGRLRVGDARTDGFLGLSLDVEHRYDVTAQTLLEGSGGRRSAEAQPLIVDRIAPEIPDLLHGRAGVVADGDVLYLAGDNRIWRIEEGVATVYAGNGTPGSSGDGGPAVEATITNPGNLALGPDGSLYFGSVGLAFTPSDYRIRRVRPDGIIETVAGTGDEGPLSFDADGALATETPIRDVSFLVVRPDGSLVFVTGPIPVLLEVGPDGRIRRLNGRSERPPGVPLARANFGLITALALQPGTDRLFIGTLQPDGGGAVYTAAPGGYVRLFLGDNGRPDATEITRPVPRAEAKIDPPSSIAFAPNGDIWIAAGPRIARLGSDDVLRTVMGGRSTRPSGDGGPASAATLFAIGQLAIDNQGKLYFTDESPSSRLRRIAPAFGTTDASELVLPSANGQLRYVFDSGGRHLRTETADLGMPLLAFERGGSRLDLVRDADGNTLQIERGMDERGARFVRLVPTEGPATVVHDDDRDGYADRITVDGDDREVRLEMAPQGLLTRLTDRYGVTHRFAYDALGRLAADGLEGRPAQELVGTRDTVTLTTAEGRTVTYATSPDGSAIARTRTDGVGLTVRTTRERDETERTEYPDGTTTRTVLRPDPLLGGAVRLPVESELITPSGRRTRSLLEHEVVQRDRRLVSRTTTVTLAAGTSAEATLVQQLQANPDGTASYTATSAEGRGGEMDVDERGRITEVRRQGRHPVRYLYDAHGRVREVRQGPAGSERVLRLDHGPLPSERFEPLSVVDGVGRRVTTSFDHLGRTSSITDAAGVARFAYDDATRSRAIQPPRRPAHLLRYDSRGLLSSYEPPAVGGATSTRFEYDEDGVLRRSLFPDGVTVAASVDDAFRPTSTEVVEGSPADRATTSTTSYDPQGHVARVSWSQPGASVTLEPTFDGPLLTRLSTTGATSSQIDFVYDDGLRLQGADLSAGGEASSVRYERDRDGLSTAVQVGGERFAVGRAPNGDLASFSVRATRTTTSIDAFGAVAQEEVTWPGGSLGWEQRYDLGGRLSERLELGGSGELWRVRYDDAGRLTEVSVEGGRSYRYRYDANGNRIGWDLPSEACASDCVTLDAQDRLLRHGGLRFTYDDRGRRTSRSAGGATTRYDYDPFGNLRGVDLPDGTQVRYVVDALGRRVAREVDGRRTHGWVYGLGLSPLGQLDSSGRLEVTYVYLSKSWVPDLAVHRDGTVYRIVTDPVGSVRAVVNASTGEVVQQYTYSPFGRIESASESRDVVPFRFAGGLWDEATGQLRFGARDYDPEVGRWTAKDPIGFAGGDLNLYAYAGNDPLGAVDPSGLAVDLLLDGLAVAGCVHAVFRDNVFGSCDNLGANAQRCAIAVAGFLLPFVTAGGIAAVLGRAERAAARGAEETVSVFHGSIRNGPEILERGLDPARAPTFVSRDLAAAQDALLNHPDAVPGLGQIIESRIPASLFKQMLAPLERPYSGFYPYRLQSTEITLRSEAQIRLFNQFIVR